ncbi:MAG TPA: hypothetical protein VKZ79_00605 [Alphaproteobacteria bacterium]|nr:hypothetical protein [Alphaproteobacteria bacterium]
MSATYTPSDAPAARFFQMLLANLQSNLRDDDLEHIREMVDEAGGAGNDPILAGVRRSIDELRNTRAAARDLIDAGYAGDAALAQDFVRRFPHAARIGVVR